MMITMLVLAFVAGVVLFVVALRLIRRLQNERHLAARRKTTSLNMAKVISAAVEKAEEAEGGVAAATEDGGEPPPGPSEDAAAATEDGEDPDGDEAADNEFDDVDIAEGPADDDSEPAVEEPAAGAPAEGSAYEPLAAADDSDEGTRETQAVSLAEIMASYDGEEEAASEPAVKAKPIQTIYTQPFRALLAQGDDADGERKVAGVRKRRLPETVKMKERKVLLVEDVKVHRELVEMFFEGSGVKFEFAENGAEACDMFASAPDRYSLILMDIKMPVMDGYEAARKVRSMDIDWAKQIPIVAMTGETTEDDISKCFEAGMDDHIVKPIDMAILQDRVFEFITRDSE